MSTTEPPPSPNFSGTQIAIAVSGVIVATAVTAEYYELIQVRKQIKDRFKKE